MSNEKPVRITVGDVKEVTEATTVKEDTVQPKAAAASYSAPPSSAGSSNGAFPIIGAIIGLILLALAGMSAFNSPAPSEPTANAPTHSAPAPKATAPTASTPTANNGPASNTPAASNNAPK